MPTAVKVTTVGSSVGIVLSKDVLARLNVQKGNILFISETPNGVELTPYDREFAEQMEAGRAVMRKHRDVLRRLAE